MIQLAHEDIAFKEQKFPVILVLDSITSPANVGSLFRLADAFNIEKIILCGATFSDISSNRLKRTARSTVDVVPYEQQDKASAVCRRLIEKGYAIIALEIAKGSLPIQSISYRGLEKIVLVLGNERSGISEDILELAQKRVHINMYGKNSSINVAQAGGIALFEITKSLQPI